MEQAAGRCHLRLSILDFAHGQYPSASGLKHERPTPSAVTCAAALHVLPDVQDEVVPPRPLADVFADIDTAARHWPYASRMFLADDGALI